MVFISYKVNMMAKSIETVRMIKTNDELGKFVIFDCIISWIKMKWYNLFYMKNPALEIYFRRIVKTFPSHYDSRKMSIHPDSWNYGQFKLNEKNDSIAWIPLFVKHSHIGHSWEFMAFLKKKI